MASAISNLLFSSSSRRDDAVALRALRSFLVASFAATTLDSATRLQRYVIQEIGLSLQVRLLDNRYIATAVALI